MLQNVTSMCLELVGRAGHWSFLCFCRHRWSSRQLAATFSDLIQPCRFLQAIRLIDKYAGHIAAGLTDGKLRSVPRPSGIENLVGQLVAHPIYPVGENGAPC